MEMIAKAGRGVILYLRREAQGERAASTARRPRETARAAEHRVGATAPMDFREYGIGAQILRDVGVGKIRLITNYPRRMVSLPGYGLEIVECVPIKLAASRAAARAEAAARRPPRRPRSLEERGQALQLEGVDHAAHHAVVLARRRRVRRWRRRRG